MATTTNYGWTTPDDTALVKDGAAAIRTLGSSVDTTTKALNPSTTLGDIEYRSSTANTNTRLGVGSTGQVLTVAGGVPSWATPASGSTFVGVSLYKSSDQSYTSGSGTNATFNSELFDTNGFHDTSTNTDRITIPSGKDGYYLIQARAYWQSNSNGQRIAQIRKNSGATSLARFAAGATSTNVAITIQATVYLVATDYVVFENYQDSGSTIVLGGGDQSYSVFSATYLGA
jgi:hypothetical protein